VSSPITLFATDTTFVFM